MKRPVLLSASCLLFVVAWIAVLSGNVLASTTDAAIAEFKKDPLSFISANPSISQDVIKAAIISDPALLTEVMEIVSDHPEIAEVASRALVEASIVVSSAQDPASRQLLMSIFNSVSGAGSRVVSLYTAALVEAQAAAAEAGGAQSQQINTLSEMFESSLGGSFSTALDGGYNLDENLSFKTPAVPSP